MNERVLASDKLNTLELQKVFEVSHVTILKWRRDKGLPYYRILSTDSGNIVFDPEEVIEWAVKNKKELKKDPYEVLQERYE